MKFEKGNRAAKGGRRNPPGGRPTNQHQEIKKAAKEIAQEYIEAHVKPLMETYMGLAAGKVVERRTAKGKKKFELSVDPSTTRDAVGKLVPDAKVEQGEASRPVQITFLQFSRNPGQPGQNSSEPWTGPSEVKSPILLSDNRNGDEAGGQGVAPVKLQFANFSNGKRRK